MVKMMGIKVGDRLNTAPTDSVSEKDNQKLRCPPGVQQGGEAVHKDGPKEYIEEIDEGARPRSG
jgi:hypothetical protein